MRARFYRCRRSRRRRTAGAKVKARSWRRRRVPGRVKVIPTPVTRRVGVRCSTCTTSTFTVQAGGVLSSGLPPGTRRVSQGRYRKIRVFVPIVSTPFFFRVTWWKVGKRNVRFRTSGSSLTFSLLFLLSENLIAFGIERGKWLTRYLSCGKTDVPYSYVSLGNYLD